MQSFRITAERGVYLIGEGIEDRIEDQTQYMILAADKSSAAKLAARFIAEKAGSSSPRMDHAVFDEIGTWMERWLPTPKYQRIFEIANRLRRYIGSISLDGMIIIVPENGDDSIILSLSEDNKSRVLYERIFILDDYGRQIEFGDGSTPIDAIILARSIQSLF